MTESSGRYDDVKLAFYKKCTKNVYNEVDS